MPKHSESSKEKHVASAGGEILETVRALAVEIGPRPSASPAEERAAEFVAERLKEAGFRVRLETFRGLTTFSLPYGIIYALFIAAALLYLLSPAACVVLSSLGLLFHLSESNARPLLSRILPKRASRNVIGVRPAQREARRRLVISAHLDSSKAALFFHPNLLYDLRFFSILMVAAMFLIFFLAVIGLFTSLGWFWYLQLAGAGLLGLGLIMLIHRELLMPHTPGANDNASGVALMLKAARTLPRLRFTELWMVGTGCEESNLWGMLAFLDSNNLDKETTFFINLDHLGAGQVAYITAEGMFWPYHADLELVRLAVETASEEGLDAQGRAFHTLTTDALAPLARGYRGMSIMAFDERGLLPNWHWLSDTTENVSASTLKNAWRLLSGIVRKIDSEVV